MIHRLAAILVLACIATEGATAIPAQAAPAMKAETDVLADMAGTWDVAQRRWPGPDAKPETLPPAIARRTPAVGGGFVEEVMTLADSAAGAPFTRTAHLNYNSIDGVFEYFSIDSRAPQQMHYSTRPVAKVFNGPFAFNGGTFVAGEWGDRKDVAFAYRVELSAVTAGKQRLALFLRPLASGSPREFLAFEYLYTRRR